MNQCCIVSMMMSGGIIVSSVVVIMYCYLVVVLLFVIIVLMFIIVVDSDVFVVIRIGYRYWFQLQMNVIMNSVVMFVFDSGSIIFQKKCSGFVLLMCVVFINLLGSVMKNWWNRNVVVVDVISGIVSFVQVFVRCSVDMICMVGKICIFIGSISVMKISQNVVL